MELGQTSDDSKPRINWFFISISLLIVFIGASLFLSSVPKEKISECYVPAFCGIVVAVYAIPGAVFSLIFSMVFSIVGSKFFPELKAVGIRNALIIFFLSLIILISMVNKIIFV